MIGILIAISGPACRSSLQVLPFLISTTRLHLANLFRSRRHYERHYRVRAAADQGNRSGHCSLPACRIPAGDKPEQPRPSLQPAPPYATPSTTMGYGLPSPLHSRLPAHAVSWVSDASTGRPSIGTSFGMARIYGRNMVYAWCTHRVRMVY